jgi:predicted cupin superfamily sugar epimerase
MSEIDPEISGLIGRFNLQPLPVEGTLYASTFVSQHSTAIIGLYAHVPLSRSLFHRLTSDEVWHFYGGDALRLVLLHPDGSSAEVVMGNDLASGQVVQFVVPAATWQAGECVSGGRYSLFGCTMAPGFSGDCFEGGAKGRLRAEYPDRAVDIERLGVPDSDSIALPAGFSQ